MKKSRAYLHVILVVFFLVACSIGGSTSGKLNCSRGGEVCVDLKIAQSFPATDPVPLTLTVTSSKDFDYLHTSLVISGGITLDGPETWEKSSLDGYIDRNVAFWDFAIKAGDTVSFTRVMHLPVGEGNYSIVVDVVNTGRIIVATDTASIQAINGWGKVYRANTPVPRMTPNVTADAYGPGTPAPTFIVPTATATMPSTPTKGANIKTPPSYPYPPPGTPLPTLPAYP